MSHTVRWAQPFVGTSSHGERVHTQLYSVEPPTHLPEAVRNVLGAKLGGVVVEACGESPVNARDRQAYYAVQTHPARNLPEVDTAAAEFINAADAMFSIDGLTTYLAQELPPRRTGYDQLPG